MKGVGWKQAAADSPMTKTGMKAPQGTGMVVARADIQNCRQEGFKSDLREAHPAHLAGAAFSAESPEVKGKERTPEPEGWGSHPLTQPTALAVTSLGFDSPSLKQG